MKLLLTSVFKPYGVDDEYGRKESIMELYHNQVTREQGIFSVRYNHRSFNLYLMAENISVPSTVLDFPTLDRFKKEIKKNYDYIGISFITPNFSKTKKMAELIREYAPKSKIILGGHGAQIPDLEKLIGCDYVVRGEGISWFRRFFGESVDRPIKHPLLPSADNKRVMGIPMFDRSVVILPGVGCPNGCRFCSTTHMFNFKYTPFLKTASELFEVLQRAEKKVDCQDFSIMDENFLKSSDRAIELLKLMKAHGKQYFFAVFSSAEAITKLGVKFLFELGIRFIWIGVESKRQAYEKNKGIDMKQLFDDLRNHGINILASTILFQEHHDKETIWEDIDYTLELQPDFIQFMQLGPLPQTALYKDYKQKGLLCEDIPYEEWHGQHRLWFRHPHFSAEESEVYLKKAFLKDYHELGPSILRMCDTYLRGYKYTKKYEDDAWLEMRNSQLKDFCLRFYPLLSIVKPYLPNEKTRQFACRLAEEYREVFGHLDMHQKLTSFVGSLFALKEFIKLKLFGDVRQPKTIYTTYNRPVFELFPESLKGKLLPDLSSDLLKVKLRNVFASNHICLELYGILDSINVERLQNRITRFFEKEEGKVTLDLVNIQKIEDNSLFHLLEQLEEFHSQIKLLYSTKMEEISTIIWEIKSRFGTNLQCLPSA